MRGAKLIDLTGVTFGSLTVLKRVRPKGKITFWKCLCKCGKKVIVQAHNLQTGNSKSCGCYLFSPRFRDVAGQKYGRLTGLERLPPDGTRKTKWKWQCECGTIVVRPIHGVVQGRIRSCGCLLKDHFALRLQKSRSFPDGQKRCARCKQPKPLDQFRTMKRRRNDQLKHYIDAWCIPCRRENKREPAQKATRSAAPLTPNQVLITISTRNGFWRIKN